MSALDIKEDAAESELDPLFFLYIRFYRFNEI